jgi:soluble lytic murein transglycosylase
MLGVSPGIEFAILSLCTIDPPANYVSDLLTAAELYNVDPLLIAAVVSVETRCDAEAIGGAGEIGLMQIHPYTWRTQEYNADRLLDATGLVWADGYQPHLNLRIGSWILSTAIQTMRGNTRHGLALYNGYSERGLAYADKVLAQYSRAAAMVP